MIDARTLRIKQGIPCPPDGGTNRALYAVRTVMQENRRHYNGLLGIRYRVTVHPRKHIHVEKYWSADFIHLSLHARDAVKREYGYLTTYNRIKIKDINEIRIYAV